MKVLRDAWELVDRARIGIKIEPPMPGAVVALINTIAEIVGVESIVVATGFKSIIKGLRSDIRLVECTNINTLNNIVALLWCDTDIVSTGKIVCAGPQCSKLRGLQRLSVKRVELNDKVVYVLRCCGRTVLGGIEGNVFVETGLGEQLTQVYGIVKSLVEENGAVPLRDAVMHTAYRLAMKRTEARRLILTLANLGLVKIVEGYIVLGEG